MNDHMHQDNNNENNRTEHYSPILILLLNPRHYSVFTTLAFSIPKRTVQGKKETGSDFGVVGDLKRVSHIQQKI